MEDNKSVITPSESSGEKESERRELLIVHKSRKTEYKGQVIYLDMDVTDTFAEELDNIVGEIYDNPRNAANMLLGIVNELRGVE